MSGWNGHSHRDSSARPTVLAAAVAVAVILVAGVLGFALGMAVDSDPATGRATDAEDRSSQTGSAPTTEPTDATSSAAPGPLDQARAVKPLQSLERGDRVLYDAGTDRPLCTWLEWPGSTIATSLIQCGEETFEVETGYLTPVELLP